jgi:hypothetical protein
MKRAFRPEDEGRYGETSTREERTNLELRFTLFLLFQLMHTFTHFKNTNSLNDQISPGQELQAHTSTQPTIMTCGRILYKNITNIHPRNST